MKHKLTLIVAALGLTGFSSFAATLDMANLGGSFPTYTDSTGIVGLTITYSIGQDPGTSENSGYSGSTGGMSLPVASFPDGHLAVGPGDTVTLDFSSAPSSSVFVAFYDLDANAIGGDEGVTVTSGSGSNFVAGFSSQIPNASAGQGVNIINVGSLTPDANGQIILQASTSAEQGGIGNGYFSFNVSSAPVIPEPSSAMLGLLGLGMLIVRRRR